MVRTSVELPAGQYIRVQGPLKAVVASGQVMVLGAIYSRGETFSVSSYRSYAIKALDDSRLDIEMGEGGVIEKPLPGEEVLDRWVAEIDDCLRRDCKTFMVLGPVDTGKSSVCALIANRALLRGLVPGIIDADVGQADVGPPACISAAIVQSKILWLRELQAEHIRFIGQITPQRVEHKITAAIVELASTLRSEGAQVVIVDTDGWVQGVNAIDYKIEAARRAGVDAVIVLGDNNLLYERVNRMLSYLPCGVRRLPTPKIRRVRDRGDRRKLRSEAYKRYLTPLLQRSLDIGSISIIGSCLYSNKLLDNAKLQQLRRIAGVDIIEASESDDTLYILVEGDIDPHAIAKLSRSVGKQVYVLRASGVKGALIGLIGPRGVEEAIGILQDINAREKKIIVLTPYEGEVKAVIIGSVKLNELFEEYGKPQKCII